MQFTNRQQTDIKTILEIAGIDITSARAKKLIEAFTSVDGKQSLKDVMKKCNCGLEQFPPSHHHLTCPVHDEFIKGNIVGDV